MKIRLINSNKSPQKRSRKPLESFERRNPVKIASKKKPTFPLLPRADKIGKTYRFCVPAFDELDFLLACRYLYYCHNISIIEDGQYDFMEKVYLKINKNKKSPLLKPGSDKIESYPNHVRALGVYFAYKYGGKLP